MKWTGRSRVPLPAMRELIQSKNPRFRAILLDYYYQWAEIYGIPAETALADAIGHTNWFRDWWSQEPRNNFGHLGVDPNDDADRPCSGSPLPPSAEATPLGQHWVKDERSNHYRAGWEFDRPAVGVAAHLSNLWAMVGGGQGLIYLDELAASFDPTFRATRNERQWPTRGPQCVEADREIEQLVLDLNKSTTAIS